MSGTSADSFAFPPDTIAFLTDLGRNNERSWFESNRHRYEAAYVSPAKSFVEAAAPGLDAIVPSISAEPRVLGSIFRINRDTRFSSDKRPYKDHLDFWFWQGPRKSAVSGLFLRVAPDGVIVGAGAHGFDKQQLERYRSAVTNRERGLQLATTVATLRGAGFEIGGETYARPPRGFTAAEPAIEPLLRHSALYAEQTLPASAATSRGFVNKVLDLWREQAPVHRWLYENVQSP